MAPTQPQKRKDFGGVHKAKDRVYPAQRRAAAKKAERQAAAADRHLQNQVRAQGDRWLRFQAYSSEDVLYQPIRLWLEYQSVRKHKSLPRSVRDTLDLAFQRPQEMDVAGAHFETQRANRREELGKEEGDFFDDWWSGEPNRSPFFHGWRWWSALSKLDENYRTTFFSKYVVGFEVDGLPILRVPFTTYEEFMSPAVPEFGDPHVQDQIRIWNEERKVLREEKENEEHHAYEAMQKALEEEQRLAHLLEEMTVGAEGHAEGSEVVHDVEDRMESTVF